jgi:hypothetical protein
MREAAQEEREREREREIRLIKCMQLSEIIKMSANRQLHILRQFAHLRHRSKSQPRTRAQVVRA